MEKFRRAFLAAVSVFLMAAPSEAITPAICSLDIEARSDNVADYVESARICLKKPPVGFSFDPRLEQRFVDLVNQERRKRGLSALRVRPDLLGSSRFMSLDMGVNKFFDHTSPDGRIVSDRVAAFDRRALISFTAENLAMLEVVRGPFNLDRDAVPRLHKNLMESPGHRKNILRPDITDISIGVVTTDKGIWVTQVFLDLNGTLSSAVPVRLKQGAPVVAEARLKDWTFKRYDAATDPNSFVPLSSAPPGNVGLAAYSEKPGRTSRQIYTIRLIGPAITIEP